MLDIGGRICDKALSLDRKLSQTAFTRKGKSYTRLAY